MQLVGATAESPVDGEELLQSLRPRCRSATSLCTREAFYVNGAETTVNIPNGGVVFYCFSVKEVGNYDVVITPAA